MDVASPMEPIVNTDSSETGDTHSHDASGRAGKPNDTSRGSAVSNVSGGELKTAISAVTAQLTQQLHEVGSHLSGIESAHRALMERLQHIAEQADDRALHQFSSKASLLARCGRPSKTTLIRPDVMRNLSSANGCTCTSALPPPLPPLPRTTSKTGYVRIIGAGEDERLPTPISTHPSIRWKVFCSVI
jgi:hypothetical protein